MCRKLSIYFTVMLVLLIVIGATACNMQNYSTTMIEESTANTQNKGRQSVMFENSGKSQQYSFQEFSNAVGDGLSITSLFAQFGEVEMHSFNSLDYGETHYCIYPLSNNEYCFVFFDWQPYTGRGNTILELMQYPSERFEQCGTKIVSRDDIPN